MAYDPQETIEALAKRKARLPLTQRETGMVMGVKDGRATPYTRALICKVELRAMGKLRSALQKVLESEAKA